MIPQSEDDMDRDDPTSSSSSPGSFIPVSSDSIRSGKMDYTYDGRQDDQTGERAIRGKSKNGKEKDEHEERKTKEMDEDGKQSAPSRSGPGMYLIPIISGSKKLGNFVMTFPSKLMRIKEFLLAMLILFIVIVVLIILVILFRYYRPRLCLVGRSAAFDAYMDAHLKEVENHMFALKRTILPESDTRTFISFASCSSEIGEPQLEMLTRPGREKFLENLRVYYKFYSTIKRLDRPVYSFFARRDILNEPRFNEKDPETGELKEVIDEDAVRLFREEFMQPMDEFRDIMGELSETASSWDRAYHRKGFTQDMFEVLTAVHSLRLLLNEYHETITFSYDTRKALAMSLQFNIWTLYYVPYAEKTFTVRIPNIWHGFWESYQSQLDFFQQGWEWLGELFVSLPTRMANSGTESFVQEGETTTSESVITRCRSKYEEWSRGLLRRSIKYMRTQRDDESRRDEENEEGYENGGDDDVVEPFGFLKGLISVGDFFVNVVEVAIVTARVVMNFVTDPVGSVIKLIFIILSVLLGLALTLTHTMLTIIGVNYVIGAAWGLLVAFNISIWLTIVEIVFVAIITVVFAVLWFIDLLTAGMVVRLLRCENLPNEWEHRRNFAEDNKSVRAIGVACCYPCSSRFFPWGALCKRREMYIPDFCPHQQIISTFKTGKPSGGGMDDPMMFDGFPVRADPAVLTKQRPEKEKILVQALENVKAFLGSCYKSFRRYDYINRHVCHNVERLPNDVYPEEIKQKLRVLCYQAYCEYEHRDKGRGRVTAELVGNKGGCLCEHLREDDAPPEPPAKQYPPVKENVSNMFRKSLLIFLVVLILLCCVYSLTSSASSLIYGDRTVFHL